MHNILQLKGRFASRKNPPNFGAINLPKNSMVTSKHLYELCQDLQEIYKYWKLHRQINGALISVHYESVVAKSNRLHILLSDKGKKPEKTVRGAKFERIANHDIRHVFTHYISLDAIKKTIQLLTIAGEIVDDGYHGEITNSDTDNLTNENYLYQDKMAKTSFLNVVVDGLHVNRFDIDSVNENIDEESIITIYKTDIETKTLLAQFGINIFDDRIINQTTLRLRPDEIRKLQKEASYLIAMNVTDFTQITRDDIIEDITQDDNVLIPSPKHEPIIGVIDTQFNEKVYFHEWVEYHNMLDPNIQLEENDYIHGTAVSSIIVDGPKGNPQLDDGCGRFRVRHFGVATNIGFSSFSVLKMIRNIVADNQEIKVWNLSLGSIREIPFSFISPEAAELDRIQNDYDVIFVIAGTNKPADIKKDNMKIGAPADSINSLVVNSVNFKKKPASYTRVGPVLSFFHKPDISYYGGDGVAVNEKIVVCKNNLGAAYVSGTSFAAPWIARKLAYLINVVGLSREIAKALLIDAAAGWNRQDDVSNQMGYGVVPKKILDIVNTADDEIRFVLTGTTDAFETYNYNLPVPVDNNTHPFFARATLAYFPVCDRMQGVDYTGTEMDIHFGRIKEKNGKAAIADIQKNQQSETGLNVIYEKDARKLYRKWDNVKHIADEIKSASRARKAYGTGLWGLSIKTKERTSVKKGVGLPFGVVVTLREMKGKDRYDDFIKLCSVRGWLVNKIDINNQIDVYIKSEEDIHLE